MPAELSIVKQDLTNPYPYMKCQNDLYTIRINAFGPKKDDISIDVETRKPLAPNIKFLIEKDSVFKGIQFKDLLIEPEELKILSENTKKAVETIHQIQFMIDKYFVHKADLTDPFRAAFHKLFPTQFDEQTEEYSLRQCKVPLSDTIAIIASFQETQTINCFNSIVVSIVQSDELIATNRFFLPGGEQSDTYIWMPRDSTNTESAVWTNEPSDNDWNAMRQKIEKYLARFL